MSLNMFKNRLYNTIIAVSLVIAIAVVTSYEPEMFEKRNDNNVQACNDIKFEEPQIRVESAKKSLELSKVAGTLNDTSSKNEIKEAVENVSNAVSDLGEAVKDEVKEAKKKSSSAEIIKRADEYESMAVNRLDLISDKLEDLNDNINSFSDKEIKSRINEIQNEINDIQKTETPEVKYRDDAHGMADGYKPSPIVGEQLVNSKMAKVSAVPESNNTSYLELNDELRDLADSLETPAQIYEYVRNNYTYKQYTGLRLGAIGTYEQRAGNDIDQAALLVALFRYKGYDARFVIGNVDIDINKAMNWLGVKTEQAAVDAMSMLGVPTQYGKCEDGTITKIRIEHAWVKVKVPYDSYRGAGKVSGEEIWVEVDPSFKQYEDEIENNRIEKLLSDEVMKMQNLSEEDKLVEVLNESDFSDIFNCDLEGSSVDYLQIYNDIEKYLTDNDIDIKEVANAIGIRYIEKDESGYLPSNLPYSVVERAYDNYYLSENFIDKITLSVQSPLYGTVFLGSTDASISFYTSELYGHKISLTYKPASENDEKLIEKYGDLFSVPSYLLRVKPVISIDGAEVLEGNEQIPGTYTNFVMDIDEAGIENVTVENPLVAGGVYGITFDYNTINDNSIGNKYDELQACVDKLQSGEISLTQATSTLTSTVGEVYFSYVDYYDLLIAKASDVQWARCIGECIVGYTPKISSMMGVPVAISDGSLYIDVDTDTVGLANNHEEEKTEEADELCRRNSNIKNFMMTSGLMGSYLEGYVIGETTNTKGVSSVSIIKEAKERGINIVTISEENISDLITLSIDAAVRNEIEQAINNGKIVIVPEKNIYYYDWHGTGYIILNPETGEAAYMISGGLCGGESSQDLAMAIFTIIIAVAAVFAIAVFVYFAWSAIAAMWGVILTLNAGISILDICIILLSLAGATFSIKEAGNVGIDFYEYMTEPGFEKGRDIILKALEAGAMVLIFEVVLPRLMSSVAGRFKFDESRLYNFIKKKWGGKEIKTPTTKPGIDPDIDPDPKPDIDPDVNPDTDSDTMTNTHGNTNDKYWDDSTKKYGKAVVDKFRAFGEDGKNVLEQYGDDAVNAINNLSESKAKEAIELINEYGDDAINMFNFEMSPEIVSKTLSEKFKYTESEVDEIIRLLQGDGFKNNPLRQAYENEVRGLKEYGEQLLQEGKSTEEVARTLNQARRDLGIKYKNMTPRPLRDYIYETNIGRYEDPLGPTYEYMIDNNKTDIEIINSSSKPNTDIDKLLSAFEEWLKGK